MVLSTPLRNSLAASSISVPDRILYSQWEGVNLGLKTPGSESELESPTLFLISTSKVIFRSPWIILQFSVNRMVYVTFIRWRRF